MKRLSILVPDAQTNLSTAACIIGALQIFREANKYYEQTGRYPVFQIELTGAKSDSSLDLDILSLKQLMPIELVSETQLIIIPAATIKNYETATPNNRLLIDWIAAQHRRGAAIASMCIGGFMLAATGLLEGKPCSTHWALSAQFSELFPTVRLQTDRLITDNDRIYTNGGAYSFLHLLLYLVEKYYDRAAAIHCAKYFQIDFDRSSQSEFILFEGNKKHGDEVVLRAQNMFEAHYAEKISIEILSKSLHLGRRNFDRRFLKATGISPLDYLQRVRIEAAKRLCETGQKTVAEIMYDVGYNDPKAFREVFSRITGMSPLDYKAKYSKTVAELAR